MIDDQMIPALLREREMYASSGRTDAVALVDEQLRLRGYVQPADSRAEPVKPTTRSTPPRGRRAQGTETA